MNRSAAIRRMTAYITGTGAMATVERKTGGAWSTIATDVPLMIEALPSGSSADAFDGTAGAVAPLTLTFPYGTDIAEGDRVTAVAPQGSAPPVMIIAACRTTSLDVATGAVAVIETSGVETYRITIERWSDDDGTYTTIWSGDAQATSIQVGQISVIDQGASGTATDGAVTISPPPSVGIGVGDWITGIPWAHGAQVTAVHPPVGDRQELAFRYTQGGA